MSKRYDLIVDLVDNSYSFTLDYGTSSSSVCSISEDDTVFIDYGSISLSDENEINHRKEELIIELLEPMFGSKADMIIKEEMLKVPSAFKKAEEYVINNDLFVSNNFNLDDEFSLNKTYQYKPVYDEGLETVSFYVKSNLFDDEIGIIIYSDDTFMPVISTKHIKLTSLAENQRLEMLKKFIYDILKVRINFGTVDGVHNLKIKNISSKAIKHAVKNGSIEYTDDNGDRYVYKERPSEVISINGMGSV